MEHRSALLDLKILLRTPLALFRGTYKGATGGWHGNPPGGQGTTPLDSSSDR
ncbi:MAG: hypothetical protein K6T74_15895 [Geminicoccaceae bacterium]|nr:hypothetical protein [Geminicoccaceae bacterium]